MCSPDKVLRPVREDLRDRIHPFVVFRQDILLLSGAEMPHLVRPYKRHKIFIKSSEAFMDGAAEDPPCDPLKRG